ncbi:MAG: histone deacetylase [Peptococcaceae bacterium]|nr:histone deacetylase [Peptococcaceae bacterium]
MTIKDDRSTALIYHPIYLDHSQPLHPESKERLIHILDRLRADDALSGLPIITPPPATVEEVSQVHDLAYIHSVAEACLSGRPYLDADTYLVPESYQAALYAAGGALTGLRAIMAGEYRHAFVLCRPPGHHAEKDRAMGFCLFNNIAIAAQEARRAYGLRRVAIVDWDVHHGNGTQNFFYTDPEVLFISIHATPAYPGTGSARETGRGRGEGFTVNIPLPTGSGDAEYALMFDRVIIPILDSYQPELILVSAGQDAYRNDPLGGMKLTYRGFERMTQALKSVAKSWSGGRMLFCLEGGYHLEGQARAVTYVLNILAGSAPSAPKETPPAPPSAASLRRLDEILALQSKHWPLKPKEQA